nr:nuclear transport factor 2 family protein [Sphingomonas sp. TREG-RG-20F-R18-01]
MNDLQELLDREAIRDCLFRYCRGVDRGDEAALRGAYWPDATDNHGAYSGSATGFVDFAMRAIAATEPGIHQMHNILIDFQDAGALVETYFSAWQQLPGPSGFFRAHQKGRYVDWFEKRDGMWKIKNRKVVFDWTEVMPEPDGTREERFARAQPMGLHHPNDIVYQSSHKR